MENNITPNKNENCYAAKFYLDSGDSISIEGCCMAHVFFELHARFPELLKFKSVEFSGANNEEKTLNAKKFMQLCRKFGS